MSSKLPFKKLKINWNLLALRLLKDGQLQTLFMLFQVSIMLVRFWHPSETYSCSLGCRDTVNSMEILRNDGALKFGILWQDDKISFSFLLHTFQRITHPIFQEFVWENVCIIFRTWWRSFYLRQQKGVEFDEMTLSNQVTILRGH